MALAEAGRRTRVVPTLLSTDLRRTSAFFARLGFKVEYVEGDADNPKLLGVERDGAYLFYYSEPPKGGRATPALSGTIYIWADSVDALAEEWAEHLEFVWGPELMSSGIYEFGIQDPDGYHFPSPSDVEVGMADGESAFDVNEIDEVVHGPARLGTLAYLSTAGTVEFRELRRRLGLTDGNLAAHLRKLESAGYVKLDKRGAGRGSVTRVSLTVEGRRAFLDYLDRMQRFIAEASRGQR